ncbi:MAG: lasso peptide biosynthesis B2 protein [Methanobacterium sp. ERen5]|nr:MAG: lasso peptide biosynthesis B2 protein [Methanobacterium sp. ERen5]
MNQIKRFFNLSVDKKSLLIKSVILTTLIRICLYIIPFSRIHTTFNKLSRIKIHPNPMKVDDIIWAVMVASHYIPKSTCLVQAITAQILMTHYNHDSTLRIGVNKSNDFEAHAWVEINEKVILGESSINFVPLLDLEQKI